MDSRLLGIIRLALQLDEPRILRDSIELLLKAGPLSGLDIALILRKRRTTVHRTLKELADEGRVVRNNRRWELCQKPN